MHKELIQHMTQNVKPPSHQYWRDANCFKLTITSHSLTCGDGFSGSHRLRDVLVRFINRNFNPHEAVTKDQIIITSGVGQAIELSGFSLCDKGDGVLLGKPHYGNFPIDFGYRAE